MRCPQCGNDVDQYQYTCNVCNYQLIVEPIERALPYFKRHEEKWRRPMKMFPRFKHLLTNPSKTFWDVSHKGSKQALYFLFFVNSLLFGLIGVVLIGKVDFSQVLMDGQHLTATYAFTVASMFFAAYVVFFLLGMLYFCFLWNAIILAQTLGARYIVNVVPRWNKQLKVVSWAFFPTIFATAAQVVVLAIGLPVVSLPAVEVYYMSATFHDPANLVLLDLIPTLFSSYLKTNVAVLMVADIGNIFIYFGYVSVLMAFAFREYYDKSTQKSLFSTLLVGIILAGIYVFTHSTFPIPIL